MNTPYLVTTVMYYTLSSCQLRSLSCSRFLLGFSVCFVLSYKLSRLVVVQTRFSSHPKVCVPMFSGFSALYRYYFLSKSQSLSIPFTQCFV